MLIMTKDKLLIILMIVTWLLIWQFSLNDLFKKMWTCMQPYTNIWNLHVGLSLCASLFCQNFMVITNDLYNWNIILYLLVCFIFLSAFIAMLLCMLAYWGCFPLKYYYNYLTCLVILSSYLFFIFCYPACSILLLDCR